MSATGSEPNADFVRAVLSRAADLGFNGFSGACAAAAIAINRVLFDRKGELVGAFNEAFSDAGRWIGHVAVKTPGVAGEAESYWDSDGRPKSFEEIEAWAMLDAGDGDYREDAADLGIVFNDVTASEVKTVTFPNEEALLKIFGDEDVDRLIDLLTQARSQTLAEKPDFEPFPVRSLACP